MTDKINEALKDLELAHKADTGASLSEAKDCCHSFVADWYEILRTVLQEHEALVNDLDRQVTINTDLVNENEALRKAGEWQPIADAPKDGTRILLKLKNDLAQFKTGNHKAWEGLEFVGRSDDIDHDLMGWSFAAPVGHGGFPDNWMVGWMPLPKPTQQPEDGEREQNDK